MISSSKSLNSGRRNEGLDLLRLIAIFFVVCIHYVGWGGISSASNVPLINYTLSGGIAVACNCAVNCFYLISGYFIKPDESFLNVKKRIKKIWIPTLLYSVSIPLILCFMGNITLSGKQILYLFFPFLSNQYWFSTCFIAIALLLPFLSVVLKNLDDSDIVKLLVVLVLLDCIQPILGQNAFNNIGYGILHGITMHVIGYAIQRKRFRIKSVFCIVIFVMCVFIIGVITILSLKFSGERNRTIADYNSILMVIQSVAFFLFFLNIKIEKIKFSKLSPYVFGIYLLNDNQFARDFLWKDLLRCDYFYKSNSLLLHLIGSTIGFTLVALGIEFIRINIWAQVKQKLLGYKSKV